MGGPVLPSVPQRRLPKPRRQHIKASQTLQQSLAPWTTFWRPAFIRPASVRVSSMSLKIGVWTKYYFSTSFCLLTWLNSVSSENALNSGWVLTMVTECLDPYLPMCSLKIRVTCLVDLRKNKSIFLFAKVLLCVDSLNSQYGSAAWQHSLFKGDSWVLLLY